MFLNINQSILYNLLCKLGADVQRDWIGGLGHPPIIAGFKADVPFLIPQLSPLYPHLFL